MKTVVLFKSESLSTDSYTEALHQNNLNSHIISTLEFRLKNLEKLNDALLNPQKYSGIIFTSPRSVAACVTALNGQIIPEMWHELHNYCVGETTYNNLHNSLGLNAGGKETGRANDLSAFIYNDLNECHLTTPFLFPCGNLRSDVLPNSLMEHGYGLSEIEVYETVPHVDLETNIRLCFSSGETIEYLAFFSPSGVNFTLPILQKISIDISKYKLIAIGLTTQKCIENYGLNVYRTSAKPNAEHFVKALV